MRRKVCVVTGSRAEYGLLRPLLHKFRECDNFCLSLLVTGAHLSGHFGFTSSEIKRDGFLVTKNIEMLLASDSPIATSKSTGLGIISFAEAYADISPDIVVLLGDRFEILSAAFPAVIARIPIAHIHGGEATLGAVDDCIRHSITKMSWWHFVATEQYRRRVIQLGEHPDRVHTVGGLGIDAMLTTDYLTKDELENELGYSFGEKNLIITLHPTTLEGSSDNMCREMLMALDSIHNTVFFFTEPNADEGGQSIRLLLEEFVTKNKDRAVMIPSMGSRRYLSMLRIVDCMVGNSSSGLTEAPSFKIGSINIGDRQQGRLKAKSIIDCDPNRNSIRSGIEKVYTKRFQQILKSVDNPYGVGGASKKIIEILRTESLPENIKKEFYDL